jgi:hypothetical protein
LFVGYLAEYERYEGPISTDYTELEHLHNGRDTSFRLDTVFLKVLQKGKNLVIFSYTDNLKVRYFAVDNAGGQPKELIYRVYYKSSEENTTNGQAYENTYKSQLYDAATKAGVLTENLKNYIEKAEYQENDILAIASKINGVSATDPTKNNLSRPNPINKTIAILGIIAILAATIIGFASIHKLP